MIALTARYDLTILHKNNLEVDRFNFETLKAPPQEPENKIRTLH